MRICHASDLHWEFERLPAADLYVFTGDFYPDCPSIDKFGKRSLRLERIKQFAHAAKLAKHGGFRRYIPDAPDAPIVCVRGNHDYADLAPLFEGCNLIHEFVANEVIEVDGLRITGHRGVPYINGGFSDEVQPGDLLDTVRKLDPNCDLYLTHYAPSDVGLGEPWGLGGVLGWFLNRCTSDHPVHLFGHIHHFGGKTQRMGHVLFSNAATTYNILEGSPEIGWEDVSPL